MSAGRVDVSEIDQQNVTPIAHFVEFDDLKVTKRARNEICAQHARQGLHER